MLALRILPETANRLRYAIHERCWPYVDNVLLVTLWAGTALAFHFAVPLRFERYATSVAFFTWLALVSEVERRGKTIIWIGVALLCLASFTRSAHRVLDRSYYACRNDFASMNTILREVPSNIQQIYVLSSGSMPHTNPQYLRPILGLHAEIIRLVEISWHCHDELAVVDHNTANGVVKMSVTLPTCANFVLYTNRFSYAPTGRLQRGDAINYEFPQAYPIEHPKKGQPRYNLGRRMIAYIRPNGPARIIVEHGKQEGIAWFDIP
jgi:hypothetical protein